MKLKPISRHIVNGSGLMGFGITVIFLSFEVLDTHKIIGMWSLFAGIWFLFLGVYEIAISVVSRNFFDE